MEIEVQKLYSKMWLTEKPSRQKYEHRDMIVNQVLTFINHHPDAEILKKILMNDEAYLICYRDTINKPAEPNEKGNKGSFSIVSMWIVTDMQTVLNISPLMHSYGLPACSFEVMDSSSYSDKLNGIISKYLFGVKQELNEYEIKLANAYREAMG